MPLGDLGDLGADVLNAKVGEVGTGCCTQLGDGADERIDVFAAVMLNDGGAARGASVDDDARKPNSTVN